MAVWHEEYELYRKYIHNIARFYKQNEQIRAYLEMGLSIFAIVIFLAFAIRPTITTITSRWKELQDKREVATKLDIKIDSLSIASSLLEQNRDTLNLLDTAIPSSAQPEDYLAQIDAIAASNNLVLEGLSVENTPLVDPSPNEGVASETLWFPVLIITAGEYQDLVNFMNSIQNLRRPMKFTSTLIEEINGELRLSVKGDVPYLKQ